MRLVVLSGNQTGEAFEITRKVIVVGRDAQCDVPIADIAVSREHCRIQCDQTGCVIQDWGSTNGTRVNGERIERAHTLQPGDVIHIGKTRLRFEESQPMPIFAAAPAMPNLSPVVRPKLGAGLFNSLWIAIGGAIMGLLLIGIVIVVVVLMQPSTTPSTQIGVAPTALPTLVPTPTSASPTATLAPTPAVPAPVIVHVEATRTPTSVPTSTPTQTPAHTPTRIYAAPILAAPTDKSKLGSDDALVLQWIPIGNLREKDQYSLQVSTRGEFQNDLVCWTYTQNTQVILSPEVCPNGIQFNARYFWRVGMVAPDASGKLVPIGPFSPTREFGWQP